jgi:hypothetical protein
VQDCILVFKWLQCRFFDEELFDGSVVFVAGCYLNLGYSTYGVLAGGVDLSVKCFPPPDPV